MDLQKGPSGILGWFALKVTGRNPPLFSDAVVPVAEVGDNYLATSELQVKLAQSNTNLSTFTGQTLTVPQGKVWRVICASCLCNLNAADVALVSEVSVGIQTPNIAPQSVLAAAAVQSGNIYRVTTMIARPPIFLPSGVSLVGGLATSAAITVATPMSLAALVQEFDL